MNVRIHAFESASRANGPGLRSVVWFHGCTLGCPGCFNPATHTADAGEFIPANDLVREILSTTPKAEGVTFSGGEPLQQAEGFLEVLLGLQSSPLTKLCFSGYTLDEIRRLPRGLEILSELDVLIAGRYVVSRRQGHGLLGSSNQTLHLLTDRYDLENLRRVPPRELILHADGSVTASGVDPWSPR